MERFRTGGEYLTQTETRTTHNYKGPIRKTMQSTTRNNESTTSLSSMSDRVSFSQELSLIKQTSMSETTGARIKVERHFNFATLSAHDDFSISRATQTSHKTLPAENRRSVGWMVVVSGDERISQVLVMFVVVMKQISRGTEIQHGSPGTFPLLPSFI